MFSGISRTTTRFVITVKKIMIGNVLKLPCEKKLF